MLLNTERVHKRDNPPVKCIVVYNTIQYNTTQYNTIQYNTIQNLKRVIKAVYIS